MGKNLVAINKAEHEIPIQTIKSHFEKERQLFKRGIKCLSLFFIDEVPNTNVMTRTETK